MKVNVTIKQGSNSVDIITDENMKISDAVMELYSQGILPKTAGSFMRSNALERVISTASSFSEEGIFSGDKLTEILE